MSYAKLQEMGLLDAYLADKKRSKRLRPGRYIREFLRSEKKKADEIYNYGVFRCRGRYRRKDTRRNSFRGSGYKAFSPTCQICSQRVKCMEETNDHGE